MNDATVRALARVRWDARDAELTGPNEIRLLSIPSSD